MTNATKTLIIEHLNRRWHELQNLDRKNMNYYQLEVVRGKQKEVLSIRDFISLI